MDTVDESLRESSGFLSIRRFATALGWRGCEWQQLESIKHNESEDGEETAITKTGQGYPGDQR